MHIAVSGNIGSGKTTLTEKLSKHYGWKAEFEAVENNPYLADFYEDMQRWSFHLQVYFLNSRFNQIQKIRESEISIIQDRTIYEDAYIFAANLHKSQLISERDYHNYLNLFHSMIDYVKAPDLLIYLKADIPKLVGQIEKRGRDYENAIRIDYLKNLNSHYEEWIGSYDKGNLLVVDVNNLDFVANPEDFSNIVGKIDREINGLF
ncbi:deoxynucleoside kinase [Litoribacter ruber]|uniref:Deoxynucleoside kinase n=1 Tax=Litoribacter ruber TaxID=702568 RepID=A0AAP2CM92_9BACT|nr:MULTISPECIES: deoxynucleoside kinase [Litoribacter]MBS9525150.1 deoxynucleoside kinase [Litoribacter alkaliphilus]MBT0811636.1 deoxynucleoside kinase [Litoribacter ruber]